MIFAFSFIDEHGQLSTPAIENLIIERADPGGLAGIRDAINTAGGASFRVCDLVRLRRALIIGNEKGTFYASAHQLNAENMQSWQRLQKNRDSMLEVLQVLVELSKEGRVAKQDNLLMFLAQLAASGDLMVRRKVYQQLRTICRIPTDLFNFLDKSQNILSLRAAANPKPPPPGKILSFFSA